MHLSSLAPAGMAVVVGVGGAGRVRFWGSRLHFYGSFAANADGHNVVAVARNKSDTRLITGDVSGIVSVWDVAAFVRTPTSTPCSPTCVATWRAHPAHIAAVQCACVHGETLVITAAHDCTASLWREDGAPIGVFGQQTPWVLGKAETYVVNRDAMPQSEVCLSEAQSPCPISRKVLVYTVFPCRSEPIADARRCR